jgi:DNA (cytosine-5)-methyltransferase 1
VTYRVLSLFAGVGGFDLGLERTGGFKTVAFCEIDKKAQAVLRKHWPEVPIYDDVSTLTAERLAADGIAVDAIVGGFPCQDVSIAQGPSRAGLDGKRSGLWSEFSRLIDELRPRYVVVENVSALLGLGLDRVLWSLAEIGYDAEWECIPAGTVGAPHIRDRFWLVGYPNDEGEPALAKHDEASRLQGVAAHSGGDDAQGLEPGCTDPKERTGQVFRSLGSLHAGLAGFWETEPSVGRVADGIPGRVDRLKQLGNAVVPQIPELIGRAILAAEERRAA